MIAPRSRSRFVRAVSSWPPAGRYAATLAVVLATTGLIALVNSGWGFLDRVTIENPGTVYIATVTLVALLVGAGPALVAAAASMLAIFLAFPSYESFGRAVILVATMLVIIGLAEWLRRAQRAAEQVQAKFEAILESMSDAVMIVDVTGRSTDVNHAAVAMLGAVDRADALARITHRRADGTPATDEYALLERALAGEETAQHDVPIPDTPDGPRVVSAVASPLRDARGQITGAVSVSRGLTDRLAQAREREALLERIEREQQFTAQVLANVPVGIAVLRADDFTVLSFNGEYDASIRHAPGSHPLTIGRSLLDAIPAASHDAAMRLLSRARDEGTTIRSTAYAAAVVPDQFYDGTIQPLQLSDGIPALLITAVNVTERVRGEMEREQLLRAIEQEQRYTRLILDTAPVAIGVVRPDDLMVASANEVFETYVSELAGKPFTAGASLLDALPGYEASEFVQQLRRAATEDRVLSVTGYAARVPEGRYYDWTMKPLALGDETRAALVTFADVTERVRNEREREELLQQIERQAAQLAATFEAMVNGIAVYDAEGRVVHRNEAFYHLLHLESGSAPPLWDDFIREMHLRRADGTPITREETHSFRALGGETIRDEVVLVRDGQGRDRFMSQNAAPIRATDGTVIGAVVVFNDVTERLEVERERERLHILAEERRRFTQAIFDTVPVALAVIDTDAMTFSAANPTFVAGTPAPYRDLGVNGRPVATVLPHTVKNGFVGQLRTTGQTGERSETFATRYEHPTRGTTYWNETMIPLIMHDQAAHHVLYIAADVTDQVSAQQRIVALAREAAERAAELEAIIAHMPDGVAMYAPDGRLLQMNAMGRQIVGEDPQPGEAVAEAVQRFAIRDTDGRLIPLDDLPLPRALRGETVSGYEFVSQTRQGDRYLLSSSAPIRDAAGEITSAVVMFTDITDRKRAERERERLLREVEEQRQFARTVIDSAPAGIAVCTAESDFTVLLANDRFRSIVGDAWAEANLDGTPFRAFTPNAEDAGILPIFRRVAETGEPVSLSEFEYGGSGGDPSYFDWSLVPLREGGNQVTGLILLVTDVTDRVLSRQRIEELADAAAQRAAELEAIIANMPDGVAIYGADGRLVQMNLAGRAISGEDLSPDDALSDVVEQFDLRYPDGRVIPLDDLPLPRALRGETVSGYEFISHTLRGDRNILMSSAPITSAAGAITSAVVVFSDITERKRAEELTTRLGRILDASSNEIYVCDATSLRFLQVNGGARDNLGYTMDELMHLTPLDIKPEFTAETYDALIAPLRSGERSEISFETVHRRKDGSLYPVEVNLQLSRSENPPILVAIIQDITERHAAEQQREQLLREIDERRRFVQTVIESAPVGIAAFGMDAALTVRMANDQYLQLLNEPWRVQGITGRGVREFVPDADAAGLTALVQQMLERDETIALREFAFSGFARGTGYFDASIVPLRESGAAITGILTVVADVTERVQSRQRIEELAWDAAQRARELETVIASIADGVMVTDAEGRIILENGASRRLTGRIEPAVSFDLEAQAAAQQLRDPDGTPIPPAELPLGRAVRGETVTEQVLLVRRADTGEDRFLMCSSAPVRAGNDAITGAVAVFRDITEMKQLDQMKDDFISIAAHELRTPLTAIKGYAELLDRRLSMQDGREADRRSLGVIRKQTERLASLVNEMLDVSRIEAGHLRLNSEPFDLSTLIGEVVSNMRVSSETHHLSLDTEPGIEVDGDTARIEQVLINLIANAITYSPEGGDVDVRVWTKDGAALVSIRDHGVGIAPDELPHLFDRFYRAPRAGVMRSGGMGLGLYICREIVIQHGGAIQVESIEGAGSTFTFSLPLIRKD